jgi:hypothetical protein
MVCGIVDCLEAEVDVDASNDCSLAELWKTDIRFCVRRLYLRDHSTDRAGLAHALGS